MAKDLTAKFVLRVVNQASAGIRAVTKDFAHLKKARARASKAFQASANLSLAAQNVGRYAQQARAAVAAPINSAAAFEKSMSHVGAVTRAGTKDFAAMRAEAKRLGASTRFTAVESAQGMKMLGMAGFNASQIMQAMPATLALSTAGATDLGRTADIASNIMGGFNIRASEMGRVSDVLANTFTSSNTTLSELGEAMSYAAPQAKSLGVSLEQASALAGLLANAGIKGTRAGTSMATMLTRLAAPRRYGIKAIRALGIQAADAAGNMRPITSILADIAEKTSSMGSVRRKMFMSRIFGQEAAAAAEILVAKAGAGGIRKYVKKIEDSKGVVKEISKRMADNYAGSVILMESATEGLKTTIGDQLLPTMRDLVNTVRAGITQVNAFSKAHPVLTKRVFVATAGIAGLLTVLAGLLGFLAVSSAGLGVVAIAFGSSATGAQLMGGSLKFVGRGLVFVGKGVLFLIKGLARLAISAVVSLAKVAVAGWSAMAPFLPFIALAAAVAGAAYLIYKNWKPIKQFFVELWKDPAETIKDLVSWVDHLTSKMSEFFDLLKIAPLDTLRDIGAYMRTVLPEWAGGGLSEEQAQAYTTAAMPAGAPVRTALPPGARTGGPLMQQIGGSLKISIDSDGKGRVSEAQSYGVLRLDVGTAGALP